MKLPDKNKTYTSHWSMPIILITGLLLSCQFVDIENPKSQVISSTVFSNDESATSAIKGIYSEMINNTGFADGSLTSITVLCGMSADELISYHTNTSLLSFYDNSLLPTNTTILNNIWRLGFKYIYYANAVLEGLNASTNLTPAIKEQLEGEAKFIRAFNYFYLTNLFGDLPWVNSTDYRINKIVSKVSNQNIFEFIIQDLTEAQNLLPADYSISSGAERIRPNKWAATALLARTYLYTQQWAKAEIESSKVIANQDLFSLVSDLNTVFLKNSREAIWQLKPVSGTSNTREGNIFILQSVPSNVSLSPQIITSFSPTDKRKTNWIGSYTSGGTTYYYPLKYKIKSGGSPLNEYSMILRLAELYLVRAEARTQQDKLNDAVADMDAIRKRANAPLLSLSGIPAKDQLIRAIETERRLELFTEWGHRWLDLKRTARADNILSILKTGWQNADQLYPVPQSEIDNNNNLAPQNPGY